MIRALILRDEELIPVKIDDVSDDGVVSIQFDNGQYNNCRKEDIFTAVIVEEAQP